MSKKASSKADQFTQLFDNGWKNTKSAIRHRHDDLQTYDPAYSWDAKSDNPQSFSRLQGTYLPYQYSKPLTLSGPAVVLLEHTPGLSSINVKPPPREAGHVPLTVEQRDAGMRQDMSATVPFAEEIKGEGKTVIVHENQSFRNQDIAAPKLAGVPVPDFMREAGPQCDRKLLNPKQRREILEFEKKEREAKTLLREAVNSRIKTRKQLEGPQFHRGVLMLDSNDNMHSQIYGEKAIKAAADAEYKAQIHLERRSRLANKQSSITVHGNILDPDSLGPRVKNEKYYQSKGGDYHALSFDETYNRLFCRMKNASSGARTQFLRDVETSGKQYNITHHTPFENWPPRSFEREVRAAVKHPSQESLEGSRNLQGSLRPY